MSEQIEKSPPNHGYREYLWFAMTLVVLVICTAIK
jgi:hypothetical protein